MSTTGLASTNRIYIKRAEPHIYKSQRSWNLLAGPNSTPTPTTHHNRHQTDNIVREMLHDIVRRREEGCLHHAKRLDNFTGDPIVTPETIAAATLLLTQKQKHSIDYAHHRISTFAKAQRASIHNTSLELSTGFHVGSKFIPVTTAGCYVPGGRYAHIASALMTVATAKAAGVENIIVATPVRSNINGIAAPHPAVLYALRLAGADQILSLGGVQGIAALGLGLFGTNKPADIIVGPGNAFVAAAKRILFSENGIGTDLIAGPTEVLVIADETADPNTVAWDLASQCEHGPTSPAVLLTASKKLGEQVATRMASVIAALPPPNRETAAKAWSQCGEIIWCKDRQELCALSDEVASEHVQVMADDLDYYHETLHNYGSLFLGTNTTVSMGDKASGPNHVLPTMRASRYTGGLSVLSFLKCLSWQRPSKASAEQVAKVTALISRMEGMTGHANAADLRAKL